MHAISLFCHLTYIHTYTYVGKHKHTKEGRNSSLENYGKATNEKTGRTNFHKYLASQNSLYAIYHPKPSIDSSLPQYVTVKLQASYISEICISHISEGLVHGHTHVFPNLHDFLPWSTKNIYFKQCFMI